MDYSIQCTFSIINYDELEPIIDDFLDKKVGIN